MRCRPVTFPGTSASLPPIPQRPNRSRTHFSVSLIMAIVDWLPVVPQRSADFICARKKFYWNMKLISGKPVACIPFDVAYSTASVWMQRLPGSVVGDWWCCWYDGIDCACVEFDVDGWVDLYIREERVAPQTNTCKVKNINKITTYHM